MRPCWATRAGTQAPPLPISIIIFHAIPHKQNNNLHAIHPNETNHLCAIPKRHQPSTRNPPKRNRRGGACVPARTSAQRRFHTQMNTTAHTSGAEMHRALPPPLIKIKKCVYRYDFGATADNAICFKTSYSFGATADNAICFKTSYSLGVTADNAICFKTSYSLGVTVASP